MIVTERQLPLTLGGRSGLELQKQGIASLERHRWVDDARMAAETFCRHRTSWKSGTVTSDDIHDVMGPPPHDNAYGTIFKDKRFVATGERVKSKRPEARARWIQVWRLR